MVKIKDIEQQGQTLSVTVDLPDFKGADDEPYGEDFTIQVPVAALGSRMVMYNLSTPEEALKAIVLEHARRTNKELPNSAGREEAVAHYREDVKKIKMEVGNTSKVNNLLDQNLETIQQAIVDRLPDE